MPSASSTANPTTKNSNAAPFTPEKHQELSELVQHYKTMMRSPPQHLQRFCTLANREHIAPLYPRYMRLLQEMETIRRQKENLPTDFQVVPSAQAT